MIHKDIRDPLDRFCCRCVRQDHSMIDDGSFSCQPKKIGTSILLCGKRKSFFPFQCLVGPDWSLVLMVYFLIISINITILAVASPLGWPPILIGGVGAVVLLISYSFTVCSDPGIVYKNDYTSVTSEILNNDVEDPLNMANQAQSPNSSMLQQGRVVAVHNPNDLMECGLCQYQRPKTARHCMFCQVCVEELDHHCPWSGKCIGKKNLRAFYTFIQALCFQVYYLVGLLVYYLIFAFGTDKLPHGPSFR